MAAIGIFSVAAWFFSKPLLEFLISPLRSRGNYTLYFHSPYEAFLTRLKVSLLAGILAASPVIFTELWLFVAPGLHRRERKTIFLLIFCSVLLFAVGAAFAYFLLVPWGLRFFLEFQTDSLRPLLSIDPYFSFLLGMVLACGIVFDLPVVVLGLVSAGILSASSLRKARKGVIVLAFVVAAVITPTTDPVAQTLLSLPLILLYEICVWVAQWMKGNQKSKIENRK